MASELDNPWKTENTLQRGSFKERNKFMVNNSLLSDVTFIAQDSTSEKEMAVYAHKYVLAVSSPVFLTMFYGVMATEGPQEIHLPDCDADSLKEFLCYLYCDEVCICEDNVMQLLYLAKKYMVPSLHEMARQMLCTMINVANVFEMLPSMLRLDEEDVVEQCWKVIEFDTEQAINHDSFCEIDRDFLEKLLERDELTIREVKLFKRVLEWAENQQKQLKSENREHTIREILGEKIIHLLRFSTMSFLEFNGLVSSSGVLTEQEVSTMNHFYDGFCQEPPKEFSESLPRGQMFRCKRFFEVYPAEVSSRKTKWNYKRGYADSITFSVKVPIIICGIRLFGNKDASHFVTLRFFHASRNSNSFPYRRDTSKVPCLTTEGIFQSEKGMTDGYYGFYVPVDPPFYLKNNTELIVEVVMQGPESYFGRRGKLSLDSEGVRFHFVDQKSPNGTSATTGQFAEILFKTDL